jgi:hypothetical protein
LKYGSLRERDLMEIWGSIKERIIALKDSDRDLGKKE